MHIFIREHIDEIKRDIYGYIPMYKYIHICLLFVFLFFVYVYMHAFVVYFARRSLEISSITVVCNSFEDQVPH